jgi:hypothetical protein
LIAQASSQPMWVYLHLLRELVLSAAKECKFTRGTKSVASSILFL